MFLDNIRFIAASRRLHLKFLFITFFTSEIFIRLTQKHNILLELHTSHYVWTLEIKHFLIRFGHTDMG